MKLFKTFIFIVFVIFTSHSFSQNITTADCTVLKNCKLKYFDLDDTTAYVTIKANRHTEYINGGKNFIKSNLDWINDCEYIATIIEINIDHSPFVIGDKMNVKFDKIENGIVYYTANFNGDKMTGKFKLVLNK